MTRPDARLRAVTEGDVARAGDDVLMWRNAYVVKAEEHRKRIPTRCERCGAVGWVRSHAGSGLAGVPDRLIRLADLPKGWLIGVDYKRPVGWKFSSAGQREAHEAGCFSLVSDGLQVDAIIAEARELMRRLRG